MENSLSPQHMDSMGENLERSNLYLKLFKLVFGSVTLFAQENELMLKVSAIKYSFLHCVYVYPNFYCNEEGRDIIFIVMKKEEISNVLILLCIGCLWNVTVFL